MKIILSIAALVCCATAGSESTFTLVTSTLSGSSAVVTNNGNAFLRQNLIWRRGTGFADFGNGNNNRRGRAISEDTSKIVVNDPGVLFWQNGTDFEVEGGVGYAMSGDGRYVGGLYQIGPPNGAVWDGFDRIVFDNYGSVSAISPDGSKVVMTGSAVGGIAPFIWTPGTQAPVQVGERRNSINIGSVSDDGTIVGIYFDSRWVPFRLKDGVYDTSMDGFLSSPSQVTADGQVIYGYGPTATDYVLWSPHANIDVRALLEGQGLINADQILYVSSISRNGLAILGGMSHFVTFVATLDSINAAAMKEAYSINEDQQVFKPAPGLLANDLSFSGRSLAAEVVSQPVEGSVVVNPNGSFTFTPGPHHNGVATFRYRVTDGVETSSSVPVTFTIAAINDAPTITGPGSFSTQTGSSIPLTGLSVGDVDAGTNPLIATFSVTRGKLTISGVAGASRTLTASQAAINTALAAASYLPDPGVSGTDTLTVVVNDQGATGAGGVRQTTQTFTINIAATSTANVFPTSANVIFGIPLFGTVGDLHVSDNARMGWLNDDNGVCEIELLGVSPFLTLSDYRLGIESAVARIGLALEILAFDFVAQDWVLQGFIAPTFDTLAQLRVVSNPTRLLGPNRSLKARMSWRPINDEDPAADGWLHTLDWSRWALTP